MNRKKLLMLFVGLVVSIASFALSKDSANAITMISYDQELSDEEASLTLKNNTNQDIHNVSYRIMYLNMNDNMIDYRDFTSKVEIEPGLARLVKVKAYEEGNYSYYKSKHNEFASHRFKVKFELRGYNDVINNHASSVEGIELQRANSTLSPTFAILAILIILSIYIGLYVLVAIMAQKRNRSSIGWLVLSLFLSPFFVIIILLCIGKAKNRYCPFGQ